MKAIKYLIAMALGPVLLVAASATLRPTATVAQQQTIGIASVIDGGRVAEVVEIGGWRNLLMFQPMTGG